MLKKMGSFLAALICSFSTCKAIKMEVLDGDFSYIVDTSTKTAMIKKIYIKTDNKKDLFVPSKIQDGCKMTYTVNEISSYAIKDVVNKISSIELPGTLEYTDRNIETLKCLFLHKIPVKRTIVSVVDFFCVNATLKSLLFPGVI